MQRDGVHLGGEVALLLAGVAVLDVRVLRLRLLRDDVHRPRPDITPDILL